MPELFDKPGLISGRLRAEPHWPDDNAAARTPVGRTICVPAPATRCVGMARARNIPVLMDHLALYNLTLHNLPGCDIQDMRVRRFRQNCPLNLQLDRALGPRRGRYDKTEDCCSDERLQCSALSVSRFAALLPSAMGLTFQQALIRHAPIAGQHCACCAWEASRYFGSLAGAAGGD